MLYSKMKIWATAFLLMRFIQHLNCRYWPHAQINILLTEADRRDLFCPASLCIPGHSQTSVITQAALPNVFVYLEEENAAVFFFVTKEILTWQSDTTSTAAHHWDDTSVLCRMLQCVCLYSVGGGGGVWYVQTVLSELLLLGDMKTF